MNRPQFIILITTAIILGVVNAGILRMESRIQNGRTVYLELAPRDPRSLMQGDYMILNYAINQGPAAAAVQDRAARGTLVVKLDDRDVATFARVDDGETELGEDEIRLRYRRKGWRIMTAPESFFFQEGHAEHYDKARFSVLKVSSDGVAILTDLADEDLVPIAVK